MPVWRRSPMRLQDDVVASGSASDAVSGTISATGCGWAWRPAKGNENRGIGQNVGAGSGEIEISHGAIEAEQLFDPERA